jgi:ribonuclease P protein component
MRLFLFMPREFTFHKTERITLKKEIEFLFDRKNTDLKQFFSFPLKVVAIEILTENEKSRILITVPKKKIPKAVQRNTLKRRIREAYRLNKSILATPHTIGLVYISDEIVDYAKIEYAVKKVLKDMSG